MARAQIGDPEIGKRIASLREARGLSVKDLARVLAVSVSSVRELETGRGTMQWVQLSNLASVLGATPNQILGVDQLTHPANDSELCEAMGAAVEGMLIESGWPERKAEMLVEYATRAAHEKQIQGVDRRLAARSIAVTLLRQSPPEK